MLQLCGLSREVARWDEEMSWAVQKLKGKSLISIILRIAWSALIYYVWRERTSMQVLEHIKEVIKFRLAGLHGVAGDTVNRDLCNNWGLFDFILAQC